jgi:hypothetical protein
MGNSEMDLGIGIGGVQHTTVSMAYEYGFTLASLQHSYHTRLKYNKLAIFVTLGIFHGVGIMIRRQSRLHTTYIGMPRAEPPVLRLGISNLLQQGITLSL